MSSVRCFVVRHAHAGKRGPVDDDQRELSDRGRAQAIGIAAEVAGEVAGEPVTAIISSPYARCVQTAEPIGTLLGVPVAVSDALAEGAGADAALEIVEGAPGDVVLCSHGDVIGELMNTLARRGVPLDDDRLAKGSTWVLTVVAGDVTSASYRPPPA